MNKEAQKILAKIQDIEDYHLIDYIIPLLRVYGASTTAELKNLLLNKYSIEVTITTIRGRLYQLKQEKKVASKRITNHITIWRLK